jgi:hypothetical protein
MLAESIASFVPALVAAVVLVPCAVVLTAMLFEGVGSKRWGKVRRATRQDNVSPPLRLPVRRAPAAGVGRRDFHRASAASVA